MRTLQALALIGFLASICCLACAPYRVLKKETLPAGTVEYCVAKDDSTEFIRLKGRADFREKENVSKKTINADLNALSRELFKAASRLIQSEYGNTTLTPLQAFDCLAEAADIFGYEKFPNSDGTIDIEATITEKQIERAIAGYARVPKPKPPAPEKKKTEPVEIFPKAQVRTQKAIFAAMAGRRELVELCLQRQLRKGLKPKGKVVMTFTITTRGKVSKVIVDTSTVNSPDLVKCLKAVVKNTTFKAIAGHEESMTVTYPFTFD